MQTNRQVEAVHKIIKHNLKKNLDESIEHEQMSILIYYGLIELHFRTTTGQKPLLLAYGYKAMIPIKVGTLSLSRDTLNEED